MERRGLRFNSFGVLTAIILFASVVPYLNTLYNGFLYDDNFIILQNAWIRETGHLREIFTSNMWGFKLGSYSNYYRPLVHVILMAEFFFFGLKPWAYHLVNIVAHAINSLLVFLIALSLFKRVSAPEDGTPSIQTSLVAFAAALIFAAHPVHVEALGLASVIAELTLSIMYLLTVYFYIRHETSASRGSVFLALSLLAFTAGLLLKETAVTAGAAIFFYDIIFVRRFDKGHIAAQALKYLAYGAALVGYLLLRYYLLGEIIPEKQNVSLSAFQTALNVLPLAAGYVKILFYPVALNAFYTFHPVYSVIDGAAIFSLVVIAALAASAVMMRSNRVALFSIIWAAVAIAPALYIPGVGVRGNAFSERYLYAPSAGLLIFFVACWASALSRWKGRAAVIFLAVVFIVTAVFSVMTFLRNRVWENDYTLWKDTALKTTDSAVVYINLGSAADGLGLKAEAIAAYKDALKITPYSAEVYNNIGVINAAEGKMPEAVENFKKAMSLTSNYGKLSQIHENAGDAYLRSGMLDDARAEFTESVRLGRRTDGLYVKLGGVLLAKGLYADAAESFKTALEINPANGQASDGFDRASSKR